MIVDEFPSGRGYADVAMIPKRFANVPILIIEFKWNKTATKAIEQIDDNKYYSVLENYGGEILFVGINYSMPDGKHTCQITKFDRHNGVNRVIGTSQ